jgi:hypothetical protein
MTGGGITSFFGMEFNFPAKRLWARRLLYSNPRKSIRVASDLLPGLKSGASGKRVFEEQASAGCYGIDSSPDGGIGIAKLSFLRWPPVRGFL